MSEEHNDLAPEQWKVYGYVVLKQMDNKKWEAEVDDEHPNLPAYEQFRPIADDRVTYLREHGIEARVLALLIDEDYDTPERMDEAKKERHDDGEKKRDDQPNKD